tara:strand:+ start:628 stop:1419 length:792 start_codon:yes stop_codon:yes gene_type:complete
VSSSSSNKQPLMVDRPATSSTLLTTASGGSFQSVGLVPTAVGNATKIFDCDSGLTDTSISGAYIDEIWLRHVFETDTAVITGQNLTTGTYAANSTSCVVTTSQHRFNVGDKVYLNFTTWSSGSVPIDGQHTVSAVTDGTFTVTIPSQGSITGNVSFYDNTVIAFYLVETGTVTNTNQFFPLFATYAKAAGQNCSTLSLTQQQVLPFINHPTVQAGANFGGANTAHAPKQRGLMLKRGQAIYAAVEGTTALTYGFYINVQGGFY